MWEPLKYKNAHLFLLSTADAYWPGKNVHQLFSAHDWPRVRLANRLSKGDLLWQRHGN